MRAISGILIGVLLTGLGACYKGGSEAITGQPRFGFVATCPPDCSGTDVLVAGYGYILQTHETVTGGTILAYQTNPGTSERYLGSVTADLIDTGEPKVPDAGQLRLQASPALGVRFTIGNSIRARRRQPVIP